MITMLAIDILMQKHDDATKYSSTRKHLKQRMALRKDERVSNSFSCPRVGQSKPYCARSPEMWRGETVIQTAYCGEMSQKCQVCGAFFWKAEVEGCKPTEYPCCKPARGGPDGVLSDDGRSFPQQFAEFHSNTPLGRDLYKNSRSNNNELALASTVMNTVNFSHGMAPLRIQGVIHRKMSRSLFPEKSKNPAFAQTWYVDPESNERKSQLQGRSLDYLYKLLIHHNPYIIDTLTIREFMANSENAENISVVYDQKNIPSSVHKGTYNAPAATGTTHVGAIYHDDVTADMKKHGLIMENRHDGTLTEVSHLNQNFDPLHFVLMFPTGQSGWTTGIPDRSGNGTEQTCLEFYKNRLRIRYEICKQTKHHRYTIWKHFKGYYSASEHMFTIGRLFQEYVIECYTKILDDKYGWIKSSRGQCKIKAASYAGVCDNFAQGNTQFGVHKKLILPSSFIGSPRDYTQRYQDALALCREHGKPDLFITMTCNINWQEIQDELKPGECWTNRPDLTCRVFAMKLSILLAELEGGKLGAIAKGLISVVEFQKRGLPHAHILIIFDKKLDDADDFDRYVSAEIPDKETSPKLYELVMKHQIHRPCQDNPHAPCRQGKNSTAGHQDALDHCSKYFPKEFCNCTEGHPDDSYPKYRRRSPEQGGVTGVLPVSSNSKKEIDNSWVIPYNPALLLFLDCHVNVEVTSGIDAVKYIYKYVYKGNDKVFYHMKDSDTPGVTDEPGWSRAARYLTAPESYFCIFHSCMRFIMRPAVCRLAVHVEDAQQVRIPTVSGVSNKDHEEAEIDHGDDEEQQNEMLEHMAVAVAEGPPASSLTEYFKYCRCNSILDPHCRLLTYHQFPAKYRWKKDDDGDYGWVLKKDGNQGGYRHSKVIGRMYRVVPSQGELYYLRLLLLHTPGCTGYSMLKQSWKPDDEISCTPVGTVSFVVKGVGEDHLCSGMMGTYTEKPMHGVTDFTVNTHKIYFKDEIGNSRSPVLYYGNCGNWCIAPNIDEINSDESTHSLRATNGDPNLQHPLCNWETCEMCDTFQDACYRRKLIGYDNDKHWHDTMLESRASDSDYRMRKLFVMILMHCHPSSPETLFEEFKESMIKGTAHRQDVDPSSDIAQSMLLVHLHNDMDALGYNPDSGRPIPLRPTQEHQDELARTGRVKYALECAETTAVSLDESQRALYDSVFGHLERGTGGIYFVNAGGGSGKTYLLNSIIWNCIGMDIEVVATATTGVAATLLHEGTTFHSITKAFIEIPSAASEFNIDISSREATKLRGAKVMIIDEAGAMNKVLLDSLDLTLKAVCSSTKPFGGKIIILGGDFRQLLPVVQRGNQYDVQNACLVKADCWEQVRVHHLKQNHRKCLGEAASEENESYWSKVDAIGLGSGFKVDSGQLQADIPPEVLLDCSSKDTELERVDSLIDFVYGLGSKVKSGSKCSTNHSPDWFKNRRIITAKNADVDMINERVMSRFDGQVWISKSSDHMEPGEMQQEGNISCVSDETLNKQKPRSVPPHELRIQQNMPYMITRNLNMDMGLCNGTVVIPVAYNGNTVTVKIPEGNKKFDASMQEAFRSRHITQKTLSDRLVDIPRICFIPSSGDAPFVFRRIQFPLQPAMACTVHKVQGQTLERCGVYLPAPIFSHGQLYVALSRVPSHTGIRVLVTIKGTTVLTSTANVVYTMVLKCIIDEETMESVEIETREPPEGTVQTPYTTKRHVPFPQKRRQRNRNASVEYDHSTDAQDNSGAYMMEKDELMRYLDYVPTEVPGLGFCGFQLCSLAELDVSVETVFVRLAQESKKIIDIDQVWPSCGRHIEDHAQDRTSIADNINEALAIWNDPSQSPNFDDRCLSFIPHANLWFKDHYWALYARAFQRTVILLESGSSPDTKYRCMLFDYQPRTLEHTSNMPATSVYFHASIALEDARLIANEQQCVVVLLRGEGCGSHFELCKRRFTQNHCLGAMGVKINRSSVNMTNEHTLNATNVSPSGNAHGHLGIEEDEMLLEQLDSFDFATDQIDDAIDALSQLDCAHPEIDDIRLGDTGVRLCPKCHLASVHPAEHKSRGQRPSDPGNRWKCDTCNCTFTECTTCGLLIKHCNHRHFEICINKNENSKSQNLAQNLLYKNIITKEGSHDPCPGTCTGKAVPLRPSYDAWYTSVHKCNGPCGKRWRQCGSCKTMVQDVPWRLRDHKKMCAGNVVSMLEG